MTKRPSEEAEIPEQLKKGDIMLATTTIETPNGDIEPNHFLYVIEDGGEKVLVDAGDEIGRRIRLPRTSMRYVDSQPTGEKSAVQGTRDQLGSV